ncbi:MAG TPA: ATP-binding protein [Candidatus Acidoferrales bacterium]|nr:ATP-binding protein [Candidatus Acidoferrales bacterium]
MKQTDASAFSPRAGPVHASPNPGADLASLRVDFLPSEAAFHALFDSSSEALLVIDKAGAIQKANRRARELLRLREANVRRTTLGELLPDPPDGQVSKVWFPKPHPTTQSLETSLSGGVHVRITLRAILPGSEYLLLCLEEGSIVRRAEEKWRQLEAELRSVLDSVQSGIILFDSSGGLRFSSARFKQLFGIGVNEFARIKQYSELEELVANRFRNPGAFAAPWKAFERGAGEPGHDELEMVRPPRRVLERFVRPVLDAEGRTAGWLELYSDVTGERQIQSKMLQTEKMAAVGQLVSGIAHELNNPLTAIMGYAQLLLGHSLRPAQLAEARKVFHEAERARRIVKNLLYFARENKPERTRVDLNEIVERTLALRSYELKVENIVVNSELAPGLPLTMADPYQLQQVVLNLLINAEHALLEQRGQGHIRIATRRLAPGSVPRAGERILLEISDDGPGIRQEIASRIFDPFFTTKPPGVGTGLGLSIVYGIVHHHGGEVTLENPPGGGAKFVVEIPVVAVPADAGEVRSSPSVSRRGAVPSGRILVVEDEPTVAQLVVDALREEGHQAEAVLDSQDGLTRLSRSRFDLVICDLRMPRLDGPAFYDALVRAGSPVRDRILFTTGDTLAPRTLEFLKSKDLPYLEKPFLVEELKLAVSRLLDACRPDNSKAQNTVVSRYHDSKTRN